MADFKILCPACTSILSSKKPIPNGKKITCPNCKKPFVAATSEPGAPSDSGSLDFEFIPGSNSGAVPKPAEEKAGTKVADKPGKSGSRVGKPSGSRHGLLVAMVFLLVLAAGGGGAATVFFIMKQPDTPVVAQKKEKEKKKDAKSEEKTTSQTAVKDKGKAKEEKAGQNARAVADAKGADAKAEAEKQAPAAGSPAGKRVAVAAKIAYKPADWKEYKSPKGGYTVQFPSAPNEAKERDEDIIFFETKADWNDTEYEIKFFKLKKDELNVPVKDRLNAIAEQYKDAIQEKSEIQLGGQPALHLRMILADKKTMAFERWAVYKGHVFQISVSGDKEKLGPDQVSRFLDSFQLTGEPQGEFLDLGAATTIPEVKKK